jgi:primosomal protein N' (replication factor Y)
MAVSSGHYEPLLRHELQQRQAVKLPPTIRIASISGSASLVATARETLEQTGGVTDVLGPVAMEDGIRIIVRFSYAMGQIVTKELRSLRAKVALGGGRKPTERLRIVVDDPDRLDSLFHE